MVQLASELAPASSAKAAAAPRRQLSWFGVLPYFAFVAMFLVWPTLSVVWQAIHDKGGGLTFRHLHEALTGQGSQYSHALHNSLLLSAVTAVIGGIVGLVCAYALVTLQRPRWMKGFVTTFSGVASQAGGVSLAFMFIAAFGFQGLITKFLRDHFHYDLTTHGYSLLTFRGLEFVYLYFQIPLMVLLMLPSIEGLRPAWSEAAAGLGASRLKYWLRVGLPILWPSILGGMVLLFANAFSAYATAYALTTGQVNLIPIQIGFFMQGNVLDDPQLGNALAVIMIVVIALAIVAYQLLRRRSSRWLR
jgi:putative spermidine/putrescine transport system permease protein